MSTKTANASSTATVPAPKTKIDSEALQSSLQTLVENYKTTTPARVKLIDSFLLFIFVSGVLQFAYRVLITVYPFYAFAGGALLTSVFMTDASPSPSLLVISFGSTVGQFVLLAGLRAQVAPGRDAEFKQVSQERAFADFVAASVVLHLFAFNFLG